MRNKFLLQSIIIFIALILFAVFDLPENIQNQYAPWLPKVITDQKVNLGLDLQGGSQLDYKIDLRSVPSADQNSIIDGIINVIQKRVNGLGVAEPNIYASSVGDEKHIIVELAGVKDLDKAKEIVGKTIQLEFKIPREKPDPNHAETVKEEASKALAILKEPSQDFKVFGEEEANSNPSSISYSEDQKFLFKDQLSSNIADKVFNLEIGQIYPELISTENEYTLDGTGNLIQMTGFNIIKLLDKQEQDKEIKNPRAVKVQHILIAFKGASSASADITRNEEEAKSRAEEVLSKLKNGESFDTLAQEYSDDPSNKATGGVLDKAVAEGSSDYVKEFTDASLALQNAGDMSAVTKSPFGFHIIKAQEIIPAVDKVEKENAVKLAKIFYSSADDPWEATELNGKFFQRADVEFDQLYQPHVSISFNAEGGKLFEELTGKNVGKPIAIFVGGNLISAPNVNEKISGGKAVITGSFTVQEAQNLARDLNTGAIPAPIVLSGQYNIGASLGQDALTKSLHAGYIGLALVALFMILYYHFAGLIASIALLFYTIVLIFLIKSSLPLSFSLAISILIFGYLISQIVKSKESGPEKIIALILSCFVLFFLAFLLATPIVLTLAGIAGVILSIGMAVDANVLIFERVKEEIRDGRQLDSAVDIGFDRAWSSIKDSNFSSLITCAILFYFGSSIIQGFAFNLAAGILISMFTAISITRVLLKVALNSKLGKIKSFFGVTKKLNPKLLPITQNRKISYAISLTAIILSIVALFTIGLKPSLDFTGGSLIEVQFAKNVSTEDLSKSLLEIQDKINNERTTSNQQVLANENSDNSLNISATNTKLELGDIHVITSNDAIIIKTKDISTEDHDLIIKELKDKYGDLEEKRFQSVGPVIGKSMTNKAILAVLIVSLAIIIYIAFAFRKIPASVGKWKFGVSAILALIHDVIILVGIYIVLGLTMGLEIDALFITAILTVMGFSVHDTIVILDRLREKLRSPSKDKTLEILTNEAINDTLARSINTSLTTALALFALAIFGAENIQGFNLALLIGILVGTYSSIFIASPIIVDWHAMSQQKKK